MPLIIVTGYPSSGKSTTSTLIKEYLAKEKGVTVDVVSENDLVEDKDATYRDSIKEKTVRGELKAAAIRGLDKKRVLIVDGLNYIKGFRYELYCASKAAKTTQCTVHCDLSPEDAWSWNEGRGNQTSRYSKETFDGLVMRYEAPIAHNRWDSPLFLSLSSGPPVDCQSIHAALFDRRAPPPNLSTQSAPVSSASFLLELDCVTKKIVQAVLEAQREGCWSEGDALVVPGTSERVTMVAGANMAKLTRARRQFLVYAKSRAVDDVDKLATMFVQYLNTALSGEEA